MALDGNGIEPQTASAVKRLSTFAVFSKPNTYTVIRANAINCWIFNEFYALGCVCARAFFCVGFSFVCAMLDRESRGTSVGLFVCVPSNVRRKQVDTDSAGGRAQN